ncbi:hypothetical protein ACLBX9_09820 [Methylobacterium sp. A49B]
MKDVELFQHLQLALHGALGLRTLDGQRRDLRPTPTAHRIGVVGQHHGDEFGDAIGDVRPHDVADGFDAHSRGPGKTSSSGREACPAPGTRRPVG